MHHHVEKTEGKHRWRGGVQTSHIIPHAIPNRTSNVVETAGIITSYHISSHLESNHQQLSNGERRASAGERGGERVEGAGEGEGGREGGRGRVLVD